MVSTPSPRLSGHPPQASSAGKSTPLLSVEQVERLYDGSNGGAPTRALASTTFQVSAGEFICIVGPSGCGKSTLLRILGGLLQPTRGHVYLQGQELTEPRPEIGYVFQHANLMPWRTVLHNVALPLQLQRLSKSEVEERARAAVALVGLEGFESAYPRQLSGGMAQRAALARTLVHAPELLLLDEPFGALDAITRERMNLELLGIRQSYHYTAVMVTHSISEAVFLADRVLVLSHRPGRVVNEIVIGLRKPRTLDLMGSPEFGLLTQELRSAIDPQTF